MRYKCLENFEPLSTFPVHRESLTVFGDNRTKKEGKQDDGATRTRTVKRTARPSKQVFNP